MTSFNMHLFEYLDNVGTIQIQLKINFSNFALKFSTEDNYSATL